MATLNKINLRISTSKKIHTYGQHILLKTVMRKKQMVKRYIILKGEMKTFSADFPVE